MVLAIPEFADCRVVEELTPGVVTAHKKLVYIHLPNGAQIENHTPITDEVTFTFGINIRTKKYSFEVLYSLVEKLRLGLVEQNNPGGVGYLPTFVDFVVDTVPKHDLSEIGITWVVKTEVTRGNL